MVVCLFCCLSTPFNLIASALFTRPSTSPLFLSPFYTESALPTAFQTVEDLIDHCCRHLDEDCRLQCRRLVATDTRIRRCPQSFDSVPAFLEQALIAPSAASLATSQAHPTSLEPATA